MKRLYLGILAFLFLQQINAQDFRIYVNHIATGNNDGTTWEHAFTDLQAALDEATNTDLKEIWVAKGTYYPSKIVDVNEDDVFEEREKTFQLVDGSKIYGGFDGTETSLEQRAYETHVTTLSGNLGDLSSSDDNAFHVVYSSGVSTTTFDGFTVREGNANGGNFDNINSKGGGLRNMNPEILIENCTFTNNSAHGGGGVSSSSSITLKDCKFIHNTAAGGGGVASHPSSSSNFTLINCTFTGNSATNHGGGLFSTFSSSLTLVNCVFTGNSARDFGGGISSFSPLRLTNCTIMHNYARAYGGGIFSNAYSLTLMNCSIINNSVLLRGGGIYSMSSFTTLVNSVIVSNNSEKNGGGIYSRFGSIINCTIANNSAIAQGGGVYKTDNGTINVQNSILDNNIANGNINSAYREEGTINLYNSLLEETTCPTGIICHEGNIFGQDPLFVNPTNNDFSLQDNSPAINAGNNDYLPADNYDLDEDGNTGEAIPYDIVGNIREQMNVVDMGAYEAMPPCIPEIVYVNHAATGDNTGADWTNAFTDLQVALTQAEHCPEVKEIWVAQGIYYPSNIVDVNRDDIFEVREKTFQLVDDVKMYGGFNGTETTLEERDYETHITTLSGNIGDSASSDDNAFNVVYSNGNHAVVFDGFTVREGNANRSSGGHGGGICSSSSLILTNCIFTNNSANNNGAGIYLSNSSSILRSTNCKFINNSAGISGGGIHANSSALILKDCTFTHNSANNNGAGIYSFAIGVCHLTLTNCTFTNNSVNNNGAGVYSFAIAPSTFGITNCAFTNNSATNDGGGVYFVSHAPFMSLFYASTFGVTNCTFTNNSATNDGGGIYSSITNTPSTFGVTNCTFTNNSATNDGGGVYSFISDAPSTFGITNCTFTNNSATNDGGGMYQDGNDTTNIQNSIFWKNEVEGNINSVYSGVGTVNLYNSSLEESTCPTGITCHEGNIFGQDPLFVNPADNDFSLQATSPAINAGNNDYLPADEYDLDEDGDTEEPIPYDIAGNVRIQDNVVDIGAYEGTGEATAVIANFKVFLSGAYNNSTGLMNTALYNNQLIPLTQPYNQSPWNYNGSESVSNFSDIPNNTVDWILVELRDQNQEVVEQKAGFLLNDGSINGLAFQNLTIGESYYVVIRHRNHLAVMSANTLTVNNNTLHYDFTIGIGQAWKNNSLPNEPMKVEDGISLLWNGNANSNQSVSYAGGSNDRTAVLVPLGFDKSAVIQGYHAADVNMDGIVKYSGGGNDRTAILVPLGFDKSRVLTAHIP